MDASRERPGRNPFADASQQSDYYPTSVHHQAVLRIARGLESRCGLILLTGEIGIGKTTLSRHIQNEFGQAFSFAELGNPYLSPAEQILHFCQGFGAALDPGAGAKDHMEALQKRLAELQTAGRCPVMVMDESHLLSRAHFGQLLVLSNLRYGAAPLVQILLVAQLEIMDRLREMGLEAINQRIGVRCELRPLDLEETRHYIRFKLEGSGLANPDLFSPRAVERIWKISGGLPRLINHACAYACDQLAFSGRDSVEPDLIDAASRDGMYQALFTTRTKKRPAWRRVLPAAAGAAALAVLGLLAAGHGPHAESLFLWRTGGGEQPAPAASKPAAPLPVAPPAVAPAPEPVTPPPAPAPAAPPHPSPEPKPLTPKAEAQQTAAAASPSQPSPAKASPGGTNAASQGHESNVKVRTGWDDLSAIPDGTEHPVIGKVVIDAVAWSDQSAERIVVLNEKIMREGDVLGKIRLDLIGREYLILSYQGQSYKRRWHP